MQRCGTTAGSCALAPWCCSSSCSSPSLSATKLSTTMARWLVFRTGRCQDTRWQSFQCPLLEKLLHRNKISPQLPLRRLSGKAFWPSESSCSQLFVRTVNSGIALTSPSASSSWTASLFVTSTASCSARHPKWETPNGRRSSLLSTSNPLKNGRGTQGTYSSVEEIPENLVHDHEKNGLPRLSSFKPQEVALRLNSYFKFFIVRDPFERLISAFKDKFIKNPRFEPWYKHDIAPAIIRKYRKSHRDSGLSASGLHFEDFVRYLGDTEGRRRMDRQFGEHIIHWVTYAELCAPCDIRYDVIGHHETLERDAAHILRRAAIDHLVSYPAIPPGITRYNKTKVERYFSGISKRDIRRLYERFEGDFHLFGYPTPDFLLL
ncbi:carbohydrate sulfotransferase 10 isoform X3 [Nerophis ophidion]|uniref:carbohydrate sulfotransferase 10 isoform X3 n=1 Tax=Nerophis ophidion TaxID=159077 RepID=UPI002AE0406D|nr:carbohydrate sulfotransferase 10 isoform X3 [Nerophis ophidion]XP_061745020.1 carbohydrate sulfotransferase 10 isoform X3 [Nerophis ophidion]XP_061745021.1 carbohydrate sulfotransferase 10 isoform X3 [Nerophis ophidion]XP_061745022.1 carbohydrate sulfotransferase 10 isoform X3 [Nerophis ophidion]